MLAYLKKLVAKVTFLLGIVLIIIYLYAWYQNANHHTTYDLSQLLDLYKWIIANHLIDSGLNTEIPGISKE